VRRARTGEGTGTTHKASGYDGGVGRLHHQASCFRIATMPCFLLARMAVLQEMPVNVAIETLTVPKHHVLLGTR